MSRLWIPILAVAAVLVCTSASATTVQLAGVPTLADRAELIVEGRVVTSQAIRLDARPGIFTDYTIEIDTLFKGAPPEVLSVRVPGGKLGDREVSIEGMPVLRTGSTVLLMLEALPEKAFEDARRHYLPLGLGQGHFELVTQGGESHFERPSPIDALVATQPWCTGGEWMATFDAKTLRSFLEARFAKGARP